MNRIPRLDAFEWRGAIFTIRAYVDFMREQRYSKRRKSQEAKASLRLEDESLVRLKKGSQRVIHTLERHLNRANRTLQLAVNEHEYATAMDTWVAHLRWMRLHIAYFKPLRAEPSPGRRARLQGARHR